MNPLLKSLKESNYKIEDAFEDPVNTSVVEFPIDIGKNVRILKDVSMWEQLHLASFLQQYWSDNRNIKI
jgi:ribonucleoside-triphosphate reductase